MSEVRRVSKYTDHRIFRRSSYDSCIDDALDELARMATRLAFQAGYCAGRHDVSDEHCEAMRGIADGVADRLNDRCRAYETVLRTTPVSEISELQVRLKPESSKKRWPKRRAVPHAG